MFSINIFTTNLCTTAVCKVRGLTLLLPSWNFVEVRWRSLFRSTSLGKQCISYKSPPTSRGRAADRWSIRNLPRNSLFMCGKAQKSHGARCGLYGGCSNEVPLIHFFPSWTQNSIHISPHAISGLFQPWKVAPRQEISKSSTAYSTFSRSGWSVVRSTHLAKHELCKRPSYNRFPTRYEYCWSFLQV
jgi:hypothetical protein